MSQSQFWILCVVVVLAPHHSLGWALVIAALYFGVAFLAYKQEGK